MLQIVDLTYRIGGHLVLDRASVTVPTRAKVALIGRNGAGKTTLLELIMGRLEPDGGSIELPRTARFATVAQQAPDGPENLLETVLAADRERAGALAELEAAEVAEDADAIGTIHARLLDIDAHSAPARAAGILAGLGFGQDEMSRPCASFSGGWRMRVALAAALFQRPDVLLLDEPSNHLDFEAAAWLETHLARFAGTLLLVSHDREMLDKIAERVIHLEDGQLTDYRGNYTTFERTLAERRLAQTRESQSLAARRERMKSFVDRFRAKATKARQAQSRLKALEKLGPVEAIVERRAVSLDFLPPEPLPPPLITIENGVVGYGETPVLSGLDIRIDMDDRIALLGPNGNGKSTLMRLIAGRLAPMAGRLHRSSKLRVGYFAQHQADELDPGASAFEHLRRAEPDTPEPKLRGHLGRFGLAQQKADVAVTGLSGGEKARLLFALMNRNAPHMLLLDEPTNHLDIEARAALVEALNAFAGAVIVVSHDPFLVNHVADRLWRLTEGTCRPFDGDLDDYRRAVLADARAARRPKTAAPKNPPEENPPPESPRAEPEPEPRGGRAGRKEAAQARKARAPLRQAVSQAEAALERLNQDLAKIEQKLAAPEIHEGPTAALRDLLIRRGTLRKEVETAEAHWMKTVELLDAARGG